MPFDGTPITNPVIDDLREGRRLVVVGWCQNALRDEFGRVCALGGAFRSNAPRDNDRFHAATRFLCAALGASRNGEVQRWNDDHDRTQADVLALYDRAIEIAIAEHLAADLARDAGRG